MKRKKNQLNKSCCLCPEKPASPSSNSAQGGIPAGRALRLVSENPTLPLEIKARLLKMAEETICN